MSFWKKYDNEIDPDEIFLDSKNLPNFDVHQFEGRLEKPITKRTVIILGLFFSLVGGVFVSRAGYLQVASGDFYKERAENNRLEHTPIFPERGVIYDRNGKLLASNEAGGDYPKRVYGELPGLAHVLGYVSYPKKDKFGFYYQEEFIGKDGIEKEYDNLLSGEMGLKITEVDVLGNIQSENTIRPPVSGKNITLSIDKRLNEKTYEFMKNLSDDVGFEGGAGIIMDARNGEIISLVSFPEYDSETVSLGEDADKIRRYLKDERKPFLNRVTQGLYTPGSIVKPFLASGALKEKIISPNKQILSTGSISIPNPYYPNIKSIFTDWKAHGYVDMRSALAVSSNVYFYEIGGGFGDQKGLGIDKIGYYANLFGIGLPSGVDLLGEKEGTIPSPEWKNANFPGDDWRIGDTYHTSIGQYGFQVTPAQMVKAVAALSNNGKLLKPHLLKEEKSETDYLEKQLDIDRENFMIIKEGMRQAVTEGTASGLNISAVKVGAKTGTAELGTLKQFVNSWVIGFFPYDEPKYAFAVVMEKGPRGNTVGALFIVRQLLEWMSLHAPEYLE